MRRVTPAERVDIFAAHVSYTQGFFWFLQHDPDVPATVAAEDAVVVEGNRGPDKKCNKKSQCGKGLKCSDKGKCEYKGRNCGKENYTCRRGSDCCGNLVCEGKRCVEKI